MQANLEATLATLVAIPSVSDDPVACQAIMEVVHETLKTYGLFIQADLTAPNPWLIATTQNTKTPDILLAAHLDVVPGPEQLFRLRKQDGNLYGRGVYDMKFACACYLEFLRTHADRLKEFNIGFLFTTDEERDSACMPKVLATGLRPNVVFLPDGGDDWTIEDRAKGYCWIELIATGKTAHGSRPWEGVNALHTLLDAIQPLHAKYPFKTKDDATFMINSIQSGLVINQIPDHAVALLDFRCFKSHEIDDYITLINDVIKRHDTLTMNVLRKGEAVEFDKRSPHVQSFLRIFRQERGTSPTFRDSYGATDACFFASLGIPCITIEPRGGGRHGTEEWLKADDLMKYYRLIERWVVEETLQSR